MSDFHVPWWLGNAHMQTIYPHLFRKVPPLDWFRERIETQDGDFFDVDIKLSRHQPIVVLIHGLEGSSSSTYVQGAAHQFIQRGWGVVALNLRSCSGEMNRNTHFYHSGWTIDLEILVQLLRKRYGEVPIFGLGFSLGGNLVLQYAAQECSSLNAVVAVSAPIDLSSSTHKMRRWPSRLYEYRFLRLLLRKAAKKEEALRALGLDIHKIYSAKTIRDIDRYLTASTFGFADEEDYYRQASALAVLSNITIPVLLLQSKDDPMLSRTCYPKPKDVPSNIHCLYTKKGGHVGFVYGNPRTPQYFAEQEALRFFTTIARTYSARPT